MIPDKLWLRLAAEPGGPDREKPARAEPVGFAYQLGDLQIVSDLPIGQLASQAGFGSPRTLTDAFRSGKG